MTKKRDLKRRVRERQAQTGENYTTARHRVVSARPAASPVSVIDLHDVSSVAASLGFLCRVAMFPSLTDRADPASVLAGLRDCLVGTAGDPSTAHLCGVAFGERCPPPARSPRDSVATRRLFQRARAGLGGATADGAILAFHTGGRGGSVPVLCARWSDARALVLTVLDDESAELWEQLVTQSSDRGKRMFDQVASPWPAPQVAALPSATLFLIYNGRRIPVSKDQFIIGRGRKTSDLSIKDGNISRKHAAVIRRNGTFYIKDLGSTNGIAYKGLRIDNKRIDEGDVFEVGGYELRFTYRADDK